jgi:hypothetical protein
MMTPRNISIIGFVVLILQAASLLLYHRATAAQRVPIAVVDLAGVFRAKEEAFGKVISGDKTEPKVRQAAVEEAQRFSREMPNHLQALSVECQCLVILANAVASRRPGTVDLTPVLRTKVGL